MSGYFLPGQTAAIANARRTLAAARGALRAHGFYPYNY